MTKSIEIAFVAYTKMYAYTSVASVDPNQAATTNLFVRC